MLKILSIRAQIRTLDRVDEGGAAGKRFFDEAAPCTRVQEPHGGSWDGMENRSPHTVFPYPFRFRGGRQENVVISMFYSASTDTVWVLVQRPQARTADGRRMCARGRGSCGPRPRCAGR